MSSRQQWQQSFAEAVHTRAEAIRGKERGSATLVGDKWQRPCPSTELWDVEEVLMAHIQQPNGQLLPNWKDNVPPALDALLAKLYNQDAAGRLAERRE